MASNDPGQAEQQDTYRNLPLDEARALVMAQLETCRDLLKTPPKTTDGLRTARNQYEKWRKYTATLLYPKIFSTKELAEQFAPIFDEFGWVGAPDTPRALQYDLNRGIVRLESIYECLGLYPEKPRQTAVTEDDTGDEEPARPSWFPKPGNTRAKWKKAYSTMKKLDVKYHKVFSEGYTDDPEPKLQDYIEAVASDPEVNKKYSNKRISQIRKAGDMGWLE